jgi:ABC-2 type transport system ATP-binding protein
VRVRTPHGEDLRRAVSRGGGSVITASDGGYLVQGLPADQVGDLAFEQGIRLHELTAATASLEEAFMELTASSVEFHARAGGPGAGGPTAQPVPPAEPVPSEEVV